MCILSPLFSILFLQIFRNRTLESLSLKTLKRGSFLVDKAIQTKSKATYSFRPIIS